MKPNKSSYNKNYVKCSKAHIENYLESWFCKDDLCFCLIRCDPPNTLVGLLVVTVTCGWILYNNWLGQESDLKHN